MKHFQLLVAITTFVLVFTFSTQISAATFTVTKTADTNDGQCDADCSLREAISAANNSTSNDEILFSSLFNSLQTITLSSELTVMNNGTLAITGTETNLLAISGNNSTRVFSIIGNATVSINNLTIKEANTNTSGGAIYNGGILTINNLVIRNSRADFGGGGIYNDRKTLNINGSTFTENNNCVNNNEGTLTINNSTFTNSLSAIYNYRGMLALNGSTVSNNSSTSAAGVYNVEANASINNTLISNNTATGFNSGGAGVFNFSGGMSNPASMTITGSRITGNTSGDGGGGGVTNISASLTITNSSIDNNRTLNDEGGGLFIFSGTFNLSNSNVSNNIAATDGGGIYNGNAVSSVHNSTVSNNTAVRGGGIYTDSGNGPLTITYSTINNNTATSRGGGINRGGGNPTVLSNTIIGDNTANAATNPAPDFAGILTSQGYNLIENTSGTTITGIATGNILGQDAQLLPLRNNGGTTNTVGMMPTSPAIDAADPNNFPATDQRGINRPQDGNLDNTALPDIGAYERQVFTVAVTKTADTNDGQCDADCSLREAIAAASTSSMPDKAVVFDQSVFASPQTITLTLGEVQLNNPNGTLSINGTGTDLVTISGNNQSRVIFNNDSSFAAIENLTLANGFANIGFGVGGGILNNGTLSINNLVISNNTGNTSGGGIYNNGIGRLIINDSAIRNNAAPSDGGGIANVMGGNVLITNSTINNNTANTDGGGVSNSGLMSLLNTTVSGNSTTQKGGGIYNVGLFSGLTLSSVTIADNIAQDSGGGVYGAGQVIVQNSIIGNNKNFGANASPDFFGNLSSQGYNLIKSISATNITGITTGNIFGFDPQLLPLGNYGGSTQTHALRLTSPAIDKGNNLTAINDQRGKNRPYDNLFITNASGGNGTDIGAFERQQFDTPIGTVFDFDGDRKTDLSIFRATTGEWWFLRSFDGGNRVFQFGTSTDKLVPADFTGDGKTDIAFWRPASGEWFVLRSEDLSFYSFPFGTSGDTPIVGDFDLDGKADAGVFRTSNQTWYIQKSSGGILIEQFGVSGDVPVVGDYDGDGKADIAIFRAGDTNGAEWWIKRSSDGQVFATQFGASTDKAVPGDYTGDGKTDIAFWQPLSGFWYILRSEDFSFFAFPFGTANDVPVPGDYDGDGKFDAGVFRPSNSTWYMNRSTSGNLIQAFGTAGDVPVPNAFIP